MSTGVESFVPPDQVGALYPFVGSEWLWFLISVALWVLWHVVTIRSENREYDEAVRLYKEVGIEEALRQGGSALDAKAEQVRRAMR